MEKIKILDWSLLIDKEKTIEYYNSMPYVSELCECKDCLNFIKACKLINDDIKELFNQFGIDIEKSQELVYCMDNDDGTCLYWAFCDIFGTIIEGDDCMIYDSISKSKETGRSDTNLSYPILVTYRDGFKIGFNRRQDIEYHGLKYKAFCLQFEGVFKKVKF